MTNAELLIEFIKKCPTCFNVIDQIKVVLDNNGYKKLDEQGSFVLNLGEKYYVTRNDSSLIAFNIGKELDENYAFNIVASHSDSPCFKLKPICDYKTDIYNKQISNKNINVLTGVEFDGLTDTYEDLQAKLLALQNKFKR